MNSKNTIQTITMKELPEGERPREKFLKKGAHSLSEAELLAILLRTGTRQTSVKYLAEQLLTKYGTYGLASLSIGELSRFPGIGAVKAITVLAGIELGKRLSSMGSVERNIIKSPLDVVNVMMPRLRYEKKEHFIALFLSTKNHILATPTISIGSLNASIVHPREVYREALSYCAASIILVHNHPSGDPSPSQEDILLTKKLAEAGQVLSILVLDHVIIGDGKYVSLKEKGIL